MERDSFIFYRSFFEAIDEVNEREQLTVYRAIAIYALNREEPELDGIAKVLWRLIKPQLDANWKRYDDGCKGAKHGAKGGNPLFEKGKPNPYYKKDNPTDNPIDNPEHNPTDNPTITPEITPNVNDNENVNDNVNDIKKKDNIKKKNVSSISANNLPDYVTEDMRDVVTEWLDYKKERKEAYKPIGFSKFYKKLIQLSGGNPDKARRITENSMSNNYQGIFELKQDNNYGNSNSRPNNRPTPNDNIADAQEAALNRMRAVISSAD